MVGSAGYWQDGWFCFPVRVYIEDVDQGGIVYHANHLKYAERARTELLAAGGVRHADVMAGGSCIVVAGLSIRYLRPLRLEELLVVRTRMENIAGAGAVLEQVIDRAGQRAAELRVELVFLGPDGRPARWPQDLRRVLSMNTAKGAVPEGTAPEGTADDTDQHRRPADY